MLLLAVAAMSLSAYDRAQVEADAALLKAYEEENKIFKDLVWYEEASPGQWYAFYTLQTLDVYSTYRGLKYDCVEEANPLLGERPGVLRMVTHKTVFLSPLWMLQHEGVWTKQDLNWVNTAGTIVLYNNYKVWDRAHKRCIRK
jgi:hypothetical protein